MAILNDLLYKEWNYNRNGDLDPDKFTSHSGKKVWWQCKEGHEWEAIIASRSNGRGCPYCRGRYTITGRNDLETLNPTLALEWNYERNVGIKPNNYKPLSHKEVWWKCKDEHEWKDSIAHRSNGRNCPFCSGRRTILGKSDLLTTNSNISKQWDYVKNGNRRPEDYSKYSHKEVFWRCDKDHVWKARISDRNKAGCPYCSGRFAIIGETDLLTVDPLLALEWNYEKNIDVNPKDVTVCSNKKVWWKCKYGHEWEAMINNRHKGKGCPYCTGKKAIIGMTDLGSIMPQLLDSWNYEKNLKNSPEQFTIYSNKKVWWKCALGHDWQASVSNRTKGSGCPYCSGYKAIIGKTDLASNYPELIMEWNYKKNRNKLPEHFTKSSESKVWWKCQKGHEWHAKIRDRTNLGRDCPYCSGYN